jgi:predicted alpha/beta-fold hydrolase
VIQTNQWKPTPFQPSLVFRNPHVQTIFTRYMNVPPRFRYRRERLDTPDQDFIDLDWFDGHPANPTVLLCHGLEGCSYSIYMRRLTSQIHQHDWNTVILNFRCCSGEPNKQKRFYHSGETGDLNFVIHHLKHQKNISELYVVGYSLGGNVVAKWLGENTSSLQTQINKACCICAPFDLNACQQNMDRGINRVLYVRHFLRTLKQKVKSKEILYSDHEQIEQAYRSRTFLEFDNAITAPVHGFQNATDYYTRSSSKPLLKNIQIPTLFINTVDDPFIPAKSLPTQNDINPDSTTLAYQTFGGHIGFISKHQREWLEYQTFTWLSI